MDFSQWGASQSSMKFNHTGNWRNIEPYYQDLTPPCNNACPCNEDIVIQIALAAEGRFKEAVNILRQANPFPAITGRVCPAPCESSCFRNHFGGAISIAAIERFLGDWAIDHQLRYKPKTELDKSVAIIGSGPAGLSCAFYLGLMGYAVAVFERSEKIGGLLRYGIPDFRLPKEILDEELRIFNGLNVKFITGANLGQNLYWNDLKKFNAIFLALGRSKVENLWIPGAQNKYVFSSAQILSSIASGKKLNLGEKIIVIGGGSSAFDCARTLKRLGHWPTIVYRRMKEEMPAFAHDVEQAQEEEIEIIYQASPVKLLTSGGRIVEIECILTKPGIAEGTNRPLPIPVKGSDFRLQTDSVVHALGESADVSYVCGLVKSSERGVVIDNFFKTSHDGAFAGGDFTITGKGNVSAAIADGRKAAESIHRYLTGENGSSKSLTEMRGAANSIVSLDQINGNYTSFDVRNSPIKLSPISRIGNFYEVTRGLSEKNIRNESQRCISCGTCVYCDNCKLFCPDNAISFDDTTQKYQVDYNYCKGCLVCIKECPRGAIESRTVKS